jgi:23S rRNA pseudouridine2605 synthase
MSDTPSKKRLSLKDRPADSTQPKAEERLHKVLAQAGLGSRRALEERIAQGLVKVNGEVARTGQSVSSGDRIELDGKTFVATALTEPASVLIYNKPEGQVTSREDPEGRPTIFESLPRLKGARWIAVGRLDINTTGLLLLTTDGELAHALMHPSNEIEREYVCRIPGEVPDAIVDRLARGVALEDGPAKFESIERINATGSHAWFQVVVTEGRNREVRRLWESQGYQVSRLKRVRYGDVTLPRLLKRGQCVEMEAEAVEKLRQQFGLENNAPVLTLQPVIGQRKARPTEIRIGKDRAQNSFVNGHVNEEARELRRFDHVREEKPRGRGRPRPGGAAPGRKPFKAGGGKAFHGPMGSDRPAGPGRGNKKPFGAPHAAGRRDDNVGNRAERPPQDRGPQDRGPQAPRGPRNPNAQPPGGHGQPRGGAPGGFKPPRGPRQPQGGHDHNTAEFRSWYVPEGVETGSKVAPPRGPRNQGPHYAGPRPQGQPGNAPLRGPRPQGQPGRGPQGPGGRGPNDGPRGPRGQGNGPRGAAGNGPGPRGPQGQGPRNPQGQAPRGPRPPFRKRPEGLPSDD